MDDSAEFLDSAVDFLTRDSRVQVVGRSNDLWEGLRLAHERSPDLVLMDLVMPEASGLSATRYLKSRPHAPAVVIVSMHEEEDYRRGAKISGADGFVSKAGFAEEMRALVDAYFARSGELGFNGGLL